MNEEEREETIRKVIDIVKQIHLVNAKEYDWASKIENDVRNSAYEIINRKGYTSYGIGMCLVRITNAIIENKNIILPVSSYDSRNNVCISTPAVVGANGVRDKIFIPLNSEEEAKLINSINVIKEAISKID